MQKSGLVELNAVVAVSNHRSFRRAAMEVGLSPSALSHAVAMLEQRLGVRLFHRTTRSVSLTEAGEQFLLRIQPALREISAAMEAVGEFRDTPSGTLRLNTSEGAAQMVMTPVVLEYLNRYPDMRVDIVTDRGFVDIVAGGFDAGIRLAESVPLDMIAIPISPPLRFAVVGSPQYFSKFPEPKVPADLAAHNCIRVRFPSGTLCKWEFKKRGEEQAIDVSGSLTLDSHHLMIEAALQGAGLAWMNEFAVSSHIASGKLVRVLEDWTPFFPGLSLYYPANRYMPGGLRAFVNIVRERMPA
ncbi:MULTISPECIES: LysR family transcriptional regulator [Pseudomonas]|uniref:LysR family transcriptional regulator n=1 Tax=Pseudomonas TaxID=286 RepID=UPI001F2DE49D|nr:LysR family transcriptional regulator [Pseudomonas sputi]